MAGVNKPGSMVSQWRATRRLYPIYAALATQFDLPKPPYESLEDVADVSEPEVIQRVEEWLTKMDESLQVHQFRQLLHNVGLANSESKLLALIERHLTKPHLAEAGRDKVDFLIAQYFSVCAPPSFHDRDLSVEEVAEVLEAVVGEGPHFMLEWLQPLDDLIEAMPHCQTVHELKARIIEPARLLKAAAGSKYFTSSAVLAFTRFNFLARRTFVRLVNRDLEAVQEGLKRLQARGVETVDCTDAQLSERESIADLRRLAQEWRQPSIDYGSDRSYEQLLQLRCVVEKAVREPRAVPASSTQASELQERLEQLTAEISSLRQTMEREVGQMKALLVSALLASGAEEPLALEPQAAESHSAAEPEATVPVAVATVLPEVKPEVAAPSAPAPITTEPPAAVAPVPEVAHLPAPAPASAEVINAPDLGEVTERIRKQLATTRKGTPGAVRVGETSLLLSAGEVGSFLNGNDELSRMIRSAVAARVMLVEAIESQKKRPAPAYLKPTIALAKEQAALLQQGGGLGDSPRADVKELLSLTGRQLHAIIDQAERTLQRTIRMVAQS
jgi:hypothetical protein